MQLKLGRVLNFYTYFVMRVFVVVVVVVVVVVQYILQCVFEI